MQDLRITIIQSDISWENPDENLTTFDFLLQTLNHDTDLVILPEMFTTGFTMNAGKVAQEMEGPAVAWMKEKSAALGAHITGSMVIRENGKYYNRLLWMEPDGSIRSYDKKHLFRHAGEEKTFTSGTAHITLELKGWKIRPFICYDLRFPIWTRNIANGYDAAVFVASWPESRSHHWKALLAARAIENQCYVVGVNRVGTDGNGIRYSGDSGVINYRGEALHCAAGGESIHTSLLSRRELDEYRRAFPFWKDADADMLQHQ